MTLCGHRVQDKIKMLMKSDPKFITRLIGVGLVTAQGNRQPRTVPQTATSTQTHTFRQSHGQASHLAEGFLVGAPYVPRRVLRARQLGD